MKVFLEARGCALPLSLVQGLSRGRGGVGGTALAGGSRSGSLLALQPPGLAAAAVNPVGRNHLQGHPGGPVPPGGGLSGNSKRFPAH